MKYEGKKWTHALGGKAYSEGWEATFGKGAGDLDKLTTVPYWEHKSGFGGLCSINEVCRDTGMVTVSDSQTNATLVFLTDDFLRDFKPCKWTDDFLRAFKPCK